jgi:hypothetical protein
MKRFVLVLASGLIGVSLWAQKSEEELLNDPIFCQEQHNLYDQEAVIQSDYFKKASPEEQQAILETNFDAQKTWGHIYQLKAMLLPLLGAGAAVYFKKNISKMISCFLGAGATLFLTHSGVWNDMYDAIRALMLISKNFMPGRRNVSLGTLSWYERDYIRHKPWIPQEQQVIIESKLRRAHCPGAYWEGTEILRFFDVLHQIPTTIKPLDIDHELLKKLLKGYAPETRRELLRYCVRHAAASTSRSVRKIAAYFVGVPGTGKTRAATLLAQALGVPLKIFSVGDVTVDDLIGTRDTPGKILEALTDASYNGEKCKNILMLLDDADRIFLAGDERLAFLLTLLESETKSFYSPYLGFNVDISHVGIILAGNFDVKDDALKNRLHVIQFNGFSKAYKKEVVLNELLPSVLELHQHAALALRRDDLLAKDIDAIGTLVEQDLDPGFRSIKLKLTQYIEDKVLQKYFYRELFDYGVSNLSEDTIRTRTEKLPHQA